MPLGCLAALFGIRSPEPTPAEKPTEKSVPQSLPVQAKRYFFSADENAFFRALEDALQGTSYRVFPNVRLNDLFTITDPSQRGPVLGRMRDKHVDYVVVDADDHFRPVLALELDGQSHAKEQQQYRDAVKDVIFRSGGLPLLRLPSRRYRVAEVQAALREVGLRL